MTTLTQLESWLKSASENEHLEFKEAKNRYDFEKIAALPKHLPDAVWSSGLVKA